MLGLSVGGFLGRFVGPSDGVSPGPSAVVSPGLRGRKLCNPPGLEGSLQPSLGSPLISDKAARNSTINLGASDSSLVVSDCQ